MGIYCSRSKFSLNRSVFLNEMGIVKYFSDDIKEWKRDYMVFVLMVPFVLLISYIMRNYIKDLDLINMLDSQ